MPGDARGSGLQAPDSDPQTSAAEKYGYKGQKTKNVEKNEIDMKLGTRKGSQGHPPPWFEKQCQVVNAEIRFMRHPRADADPQSSTGRQKFPQNKEKMRTVATGAHAEEHVERRCEANYCHRSAL